MRSQLAASTCPGCRMQRGNWRMILPFTRGGQENVADSLRERAAAGCLPIVHIATFPALTINHALMVFGCAASPEALEFQAYDPNVCDRPVALLFHRKRRRFQFPRTHYFAGGQVNAYEIYRGIFF